MNDYFKQGFEKIAGIRAVKELLKSMSPEKQMAAKKLIKQMNIMKNKGIPVEEVRKSIRKKLSPTGKHKQYLESLGNVPKSAPKPTSELSIHAKKKMESMTPRSVARKAGLGTKFDPTVKTPIDPTKTRKPI